MSERLPPTRSRALVCIVINQAAFPGLGSLLMGRRAGWGQAAVMFVGFALSMGFGLWYIWCTVETVRNPNWTEADFAAQYQPYLWALRWGLALCAAAWLWALASSIDIWRQETRAGRSCPKPGGQP